jgi:hypothetical protein
MDDDDKIAIMLSRSQTVGRFIMCDYIHITEFLFKVGWAGMNVSKCVLIMGQ